ncbi:MAG: hypothetical protein ACJARP_003265 [Vicingaceae bacterium]|jgi:hypothetical protein
MIDNIKKSLSTILYERTSSPLYGTLIVSWLIWNWKIIYLTFFVSEAKIKIDKISYIIENLSEISNLIIYPLISTLILLTIIPFISNGAFWLNLKFENWKKDKKNEVEKKQLLTLEQSIEIREQLLNQENRFEKLLEDKNNEITQLKAIIDESKLGTTESNNSSQSNTKKSFDFEDVSKKIKAIDKDLVAFQKILEFMQTGYQISDRSDIPPKLITILEINDIIASKGGGRYAITDKGKQLTRKLIE